MAALVRHGLFKTGQLLTPINIASAKYATKAEKKKGMDRKVQPKIVSTAQSLASKGFLRPQREYEPPQDCDTKLFEIFEATLGSKEAIYRLDDLAKKYTVLNRCFIEFQHGVPNSLLHTIETLKDLRDFYVTPVCTKTPLDKMKNMDLPPNMHVQYEPLRFHPDADTMFGGRTAFPRSSTLVTGLKYKDKYKGHEQATQWPYNK